MEETNTENNDNNINNIKEAEETPIPGYSGVEQTPLIQNSSFTANIEQNTNVENSFTSNENQVDNQENDFVQENSTQIEDSTADVQQPDNFTMNFGVPYQPIIEEQQVVYEDKTPVRQRKITTTSDKYIIVMCVIVMLTIGIYFFLTTDFGKNIKNNISNSNGNVIELKNTTATSKSDGVTIDNGKILINKGGIYTISGTLTDGYIITDTNEDITLVLDNTIINSTKEAAIIGKSTGNITIQMKEKTNNTISAVGSKEYESVVYLNGTLKIEGLGSLEIGTTQNKGIIATNITIESGTTSITSKSDGINTLGENGNFTINNGILYINSEGNGIKTGKDVLINNGTLFVMSGTLKGNSAITCNGTYKINGGKFVALGNGVMQNPADSETQKTVLFNLESVIPANTTISLADKFYSEVITFRPVKAYKNITISTQKITNTIYSLYTGTKHEGLLSYGIYGSGNLKLGTEVEINKTKTFEVNKSVNWFGEKN